MINRKSALLVALLVWLVVGFGYPYGDRAFNCRVPTSDACVRETAGFSLTLALSACALGPVAAAAMYALLRWRRD